MSNFFDTRSLFSTEEINNERDVAPSILWDTNQTNGNVKRLEFLKLRIEKRLQTLLGQYYAYNWDYGLDLRDINMWGFPTYYIQEIVTQRIRDCLKDRDIISIDNFRYEFLSGGLLHIRFDVKSIYGTVSDMSFSYRAER